jgi:hypothetical protein
VSCHLILQLLQLLQSTGPDQPQVQTGPELASLMSCPVGVGTGVEQDQRRLAAGAGAAAEPSSTAAQELAQAAAGLDAPAKGVVEVQVEGAAAGLMQLSSDKQQQGEVVDHMDVDDDAQGECLCAVKLKVLAQSWSQQHALHVWLVI